MASRGKERSFAEYAAHLTKDTVIHFTRILASEDAQTITIMERMIYRRFTGAKGRSKSAPVRLKHHISQRR